MTTKRSYGWIGDPLPTLGPWRLGVTLRTAKTARRTQAQLEANDTHETRKVFAHFYESDEGRSRILVAACENPADAHRIVEACNAWDDPMKLMARLQEIWHA
jgi:hypothetical protein